jgi:protochlorophyllide reductase
MLFSQIKLPSLPSFNKLSGAQDKFNGKKICVITGTSSGLGKSTTKWLLETGNWHIICACRDVDKMNVVAEVEGFDPKSFTVMKLDLASFQSVRDFVAELKEFKADKPLDRLVCNAAVYQPSLPTAKFTEDGFEQQLQINHLSHFLLSSLLVSIRSQNRTNFAVDSNDLMTHLLLRRFLR